MKIKFSNLTYEGNYTLSTLTYAHIQNFIGNIEIAYEGKNIYSEVDFCLVEFAAFLIKWKVDGFPLRMSYQSVEADEILIEIRKEDNEGNLWGIYTSLAGQAYVLLETIKSAVDDYLTELNDSLLGSFSLTLQQATTEFVSKMR